MTTLTYDLASPRRPGVAQDLGGAALIDRPGLVPNPETHPTADTWNQDQKQIEAHARTAAVAMVHVNSSGAIVATSYLRSTPPATAITVTHTGAGDDTVNWDAADFPAAIMPPVAHVTGATATTCATEALSPGARVRRGAASSFVLYIY